jgi:hypothetical protein
MSQELVNQSSFIIPYQSYDLEPIVSNLFNYVKEEMNNYKSCGKYYYATTTNEDDMILMEKGPFYIDDLNNKNNHNMNTYMIDGSKRESLIGDVCCGIYLRKRVVKVYDNEFGAKYLLLGDNYVSEANGNYTMGIIEEVPESLYLLSLLIRGEYYTLAGELVINNKLESIVDNQINNLFYFYSKGFESLDDLFSIDQEKNIIGSQHILSFVKNE